MSEAINPLALRLYLMPDSPPVATKHIYVTPVSANGTPIGTPYRSTEGIEDSSNDVSIRHAKRMSETSDS